MTIFVSRSEWGHNGSYGGNPMGRVNKVVCHHTPNQDPSTYDEAVYEVNRILGWHRGNGWGDIGYTYLVWDKYAFEGRGFYRTGAHAPGANSNSIGVAFILDGRYRAPTPLEWSTAADVIRAAEAEDRITSDWATYGHKDFVATECPATWVYGNLGSLRHYYYNPVTAESPKPKPEPTTYRKTLIVRSAEI